MQWVSNPRREGGDWVVCLESPAGLSEVSLIEALPRYAEAQGGLNQHKGTLFLDSLKPVCAREYFAATGLHGSEDHQVFETRVGGVDCLVPALTLPPRWSDSLFLLGNMFNVVGTNGEQSF